MNSTQKAVIGCWILFGVSLSLVVAGWTRFAVWLLIPILYLRSRFDSKAHQRRYFSIRPRIYAATIFFTLAPMLWYFYLIVMDLHLDTLVALAFLPFLCLGALYDLWIFRKSCHLDLPEGDVDLSASDWNKKQNKPAHDNP